MNIFLAKTCISPADIIWRLAKSYRLDSRKQGQTLNTNLAPTYADLAWHSDTHVHVMAKSDKSAYLGLAERVKVTIGGCVGWNGSAYLLYTSDAFSIWR